jgi:hypothetical protein
MHHHFPHVLQPEQFAARQGSLTLFQRVKVPPSVRSSLAKNGSPRPTPAFSS